MQEKLKKMQRKKSKSIVKRFHVKILKKLAKNPNKKLEKKKENRKNSEKKLEKIEKNPIKI